VSDFLAKKRKEIDARLRELKPMVDEYRQLEQAAAALSGLDGRSAGSGRRAARGRRASTGRRRGRPRGSGTRAIQALELVKANPGIRISELADHMGIKANYLYRVLPTLESEGKVKKDGRGWKPA
jgi:predicted Rossmann fold nucleotide-binding protein DprA/Smf involved in DNA uptake